MMDTPVLDVAIGVMFLYLLLSLLVTIVQEGIAAALGLRAKNLFQAIENLLRDPKLAGKGKDLVVEFYQHPLIQSLYKRSDTPRTATNQKDFLEQAGRRLPSYIPSRLFVVALLDVLRNRTTDGKTTPAPIADLLAQAGDIVAQLPDCQLKTTLGLLLGDAGKWVDEAVQETQDAVGAIATWFNESMSRAAGWYKRTAQGWSIGIGILIAIAANADSLYVANRLWSDSDLRSQVVTLAELYQQEHTTAEPAPTPQLKDRFETQVQQLQASALPIGWPEVGIQRWNDLQKQASEDQTPQAIFEGLSWFLGMLITGFATSLGAAFWFDTLSKALQIRSSGNKISAITGSAEKRNKKQD